MARVVRYDAIEVVDNIEMVAACNEGDLIALNSDGKGILADAATDAKIAKGVASKTVTAADVTAAGNRARVQLYKRCVVDGFSSLAEEDGRRYLKASTTAGSTDTATRPVAAGNVVQLVGSAIAADKVFYDIREPAAITVGTAIASLTDSSGGSANDTVQDIGAAFSEAEIANNFADVTAKINAILAALRTARVIAT